MRKTRRLRDIAPGAIQCVGQIGPFEAMEHAAACLAIGQSELAAVVHSIADTMHVAQFRRFAHRQHRLDDVAEFAHIAVESMGDEHRHGVRRHDRRPILLDPSLAQEVLDQTRNVFGMLAQGWHAQYHDREAVVEVETKGAPVDLRPEVAIRCRYQSDIDGDLVAATDTAKAAPLQRAEQARLQLGRELAHFVEEEGSPVGPLEGADVLAVGAGEGTLLVAEEFAGDQRRRKGTAVDGDKWAAPPRPLLVQGACDDFLSGAGLTDQEHGLIRRRGPFDLGHQSPHQGRLTDQITELIALVEVRFGLLGFADSDATVAEIQQSARIDDHPHDAQGACAGAIGRAVVFHMDPVVRRAELEVEARYGRIGEYQVVAGGGADGERLMATSGPGAAIDAVNHFGRERAHRHDRSLTRGLRGLGRHGVHPSNLRGGVATGRAIARNRVPGRFVATHRLASGSPACGWNAPGWREFASAGPAPRACRPRDPYASGVRVRYPFRLKLTAWAALLAVLPASVVGVLLLDANSEAIERSIFRLHIVLADDVGRTIEATVNDAERGLWVIARTLADTELDEGSRVAVVGRLVETHVSLDVVGIYDLRGDLIDVLREDGLADSAPPPELSTALRAAADQRPVVLDEAKIVAGRPRIAMVRRIEAGGQVTGYVATWLPLGELQARVERLSETHLAATAGTLFVVDERMFALAHSDAEEAAQLTDHSHDPVLAGQRPRPGVARSGNAFDRDGRAVVASVIGLDARPWAVVIVAPRDVAYGSLDVMRRVVVSTVAVAVVLALAFAVFGARRITAPIERLSAFAHRLAMRRFDERVEVTTGDELSLLGEAMNRAAADLGTSEQRIRRDAEVRADLGRYLPAALVEQIVARQQDMALGGRRLSITVLFADVVAFTPLSERLPAEDVVRLLNELFTVLTEIVFRHGGTVDKFVGDCVMALYGAPHPKEDHARRALDTAEDMLRWVERANVSWQERYGTSIQLAIGIHTGEAVVGNVGSEKRMEYTAVGDVVNVAARLEAIARPQQILVTEATRDAAFAADQCVAVGRRKLSGRVGDVTLYEVRV